MKFERTVRNVGTGSDKEIWLGEKDRNGYNSMALVVQENSESPSAIFFGEVKNNAFNGKGFKYYSNSINNTYVGLFENGKETYGVRAFGNSLKVSDFARQSENEFLVNPDGSWAYVEIKCTEGRDYRRVVRYLKSNGVVEFAAYHNGDDIWGNNIKRREVGVENFLRGETIYQNLYGCKFEHLSYNSVTGRLNDFASTNGTLDSGETWEDCSQKMNGENHGVGFIRWSGGHYYIGEWEEGWRTGFGLYYHNEEKLWSYRNLKQNKPFTDLDITYSETNDNICISFEDINCFAYVSFHRQSSKDSIFGITNRTAQLSFDVFNDFAITLFERKDDSWSSFKTFQFDLDGNIDNSAELSNNDSNNDAPHTSDSLLDQLRGFRGLGGSSEESETTETGEPRVDAETELNNMIGLKTVKEKVQIFKASAKKRRGKVNLNFSFIGNPGTGKTVVARLFGQILYKAGLLPTPNVIDVSRNDLIGQFIGDTEKKTSEIINRAMGGTLFIDEAYSLCVKDSSTDFGKHVVELLLKTMEDHRGELCIILAGYPDEMHDFFQMNSGFESRIPPMNRIVFENYNEAELRLIAKKMIKEDPDIDNITDEAFEEIIRLVLREAYKKNFANARYVRDIISAVVEKQLLRTADDKDNHDIILEDVKAISDPVSKPNQVKAEQRLNDLIGLEKVKKQVISLKNTVKKFKNMPDRLNIHMAFLGNPGTGKTEVAKLIAEIFYDEGILPTKNCISTDASGLISGYLGQTAIQTHEVVQKALGGVLFIDEAYGLDGSGIHDGHNFKAEATEALLKDMEEYRGKFCVILAGYTNEMLQLMNSNPGFKSRIPEHNYIKFPDYKPDELVEIAKLMVNRDGYSITDDCLEEMKKMILVAQKRRNFENARFVRNILQGIESCQNTRTVDDPNNMEITLDDVIAYEKDSDLFAEEAKVGGLCIKREQLLALPEVKGPVTSNFITERSVSIHTETNSGAGEGTGFIVSPDGYIITNNHVVEDGIKVIVGVNYLLANGNAIQVTTEADVIATDKENDVAVIKIHREDEELPYFTLLRPDDNDPKLLSEVIMGGYPLGKSRFHKITLTTGKIQSINKDEHLSGNMKRIYLDLSGTHGNSGSAVIDMETARVIGIFSGASVDRSANAELNYAVPTEYIWALIDKTNN